MRSDFELLAAWQEGDRDASSELFQRHFGPIYAFFRNKLEDAAEDLTQQTFMNCVNARGQFRGGASFRTYLFVVARNVLYAHLRQRARSETVDFEVTSLQDLGVSPSSILVIREDQKLLVHALRRLPLELQITLELYYVQQLRGQDLVEALGIPPGTVRSRIRRGLDQLRVNMAALGEAAAPIRTTLTDLARWAAEIRAAAVQTPTPGRSAK